MLSLNALRVILRGFGITELTVKFDSEKRAVEVDFKHFGQAGHKSIPFSQIETDLSDKPTDQDADSANGDRPTSPDPTGSGGTKPLI